MASEHDPRFLERRISSDIILYVPMIDGDTRDFSIYNHTVIASGDATVTPGSRFLSLDGTGDWITTADGPSLDVGDDFSVSIWVRPNSPGTGAIRVPVSRYYAAANKRSWVISLRYADSPQRVFGVVGDGVSAAIIYAFNQTLPTSGWHHYCMVYSKAAVAGSRVAMYYNGSAMTVSTLLGDIAVSPFNNDIGVRLGNDGDGTAATAWKGDVTGATIYNRPLSPTEVSVIYQKGLP